MVFEGITIPEDLLEGLWEGERERRRFVEEYEWVRQVIDGGYGGLPLCSLDAINSTRGRILLRLRLKGSRTWTVVEVGD